jgi:hypothetical protein
MIEFHDTHPDINVQESEYRRLLGYPVHHAPDGRARELAEEARQWCTKNARPWVYARGSNGLETASGGLKINGTEFISERLHAQLLAAEAHDVVLVAVSAGAQCEARARELWREGKPDEYFFLEVYSSALVEHLIMTTRARLCTWADQNGMAVLPHYSPGYSGWDVAEQSKLLGLLERNCLDLSRRISALSTGMLAPKKSLLAVFGLTRSVVQARSLATLVPCESCAFAPCQFRRAPHRLSLPQTEDVRRLQSNQDKRTVTDKVATASLSENARYSVNLRALRKWSEERLQMAALKDGSVAARFRYAGTTCSNLGRPLEYDYHVRLSPAVDGRRIIEARCVPAPGDMGHAYMCAYLEHTDRFLRDIESEKPLLGQPLNDVLTWKRSYSPSGCYCDADGRKHKWGLALEVIHYALAHRATGDIDARAKAEFSRST